MTVLVHYGILYLQNVTDKSTPNWTKHAQTNIWCYFLNALNMNWMNFLNALNVLSQNSRKKMYQKQK